jgi:hypothetical protein
LVRTGVVAERVAQVGDHLAEVDAVAGASACSTHAS